MRNFFIIFIGGLSIIVLAAATGAAAESSLCKQADAACRNFETLAGAGQFDRIIGKINQNETYSDGARYYIGQAYLTMASAETNTPEQEEAHCRKALEYGFTQAYMGLYFIYAQKNEEQALGFLKQYVATKPGDSVPYVILGEAELGKQNYKQADAYLREAKKVSRAHSARVDWMLFQVNYLLGNYAFAGDMLESALANGKFEREVKALATDVRFQGIEKRPEFKKRLTTANVQS